MLQALAVFIGGGAGSLARFGITAFTKQLSSTNFPVATLISNILSCLILALTVLSFSEKINEQPMIRLLLITGFCGGFSTFSSFSFETIELIKSGNYYFALLNILISVSACIGIIYFLLRNK